MLAQIAAERIAAAVECARSGVRVDELVTEVRSVKAEAHEADVAREDLLAVLAHEMRNPLAPIRTAVAVMRAAGAVEPTLMHCRDVIDRQVTHLARLLDDLLDVSRMTRGRVVLRMEPAWLRDVLTVALEAARPLIDQKGHRLHVSGHDASVALNADSARLAQAFGNLLVNAAKFTPAGGDVRLAVVPGEDRVTIAVSDSGVGIAPGDMERLFEPFARSASKADGIESGLGLGLSLARRFIEMHGGALAATSGGPGKGSTFTVVLPCVPTSSVAAAGTPDVQASAQHRVLVADDNVDAADMLTAYLTQHGYDVRTVHDGPSVLETVVDFQPQVVVLDLGLPGLNGVELCERLRRRDCGASMLIVATTGWGREEDRRRTTAAGFDKHLVKPIEPAALTQAIEAHCERTRSAMPDPRGAMLVGDVPSATAVAPTSAVPRDRLLDEAHPVEFAAPPTLLHRAERSKTG